MVLVFAGYPTHLSAWFDIFETEGVMVVPSCVSLSQRAGLCCNATFSTHEVGVATHHTIARGGVCHVDDLAVVCLVPFRLFLDDNAVPRACVPLQEDPMDLEGASAELSKLLDEVRGTWVSLFLFCFCSEYGNVPGL